MIRRQDFLYHTSGVSKPWQFEDAIRRELARARRYGSTFSFVLIGVDDAENLRDQIGHERVNALTDRIAQMVHDVTRTTDLIGHHAEARVGALLPETPIEGAYLVAERLRALINKVAVDVVREGDLVHVSIGVSSFRDDPAFSLDVLVEDAEEALAAAQSEGGNRSRVFIRAA
ncbi:MAG: GGDEF domain-containing protein [Actinomycetota bacterium]